MRILLAQKQSNDQAPLLTALAQHCCPLHLTVVDRSDDLLRAAGKKPYDCVVIDASLLGDRTGQTLASAKAYRHHCPVLVVIGTDLAKVSWHTLPHQTTHLIDPTGDVDWGAWASHLKTSIRFTIRDTGHASVGKGRHTCEPRRETPAQRKDQRSSEQPLLDVSSNGQRENHHASILIGIDPVHIVNNQRQSTATDAHTQAISDLLHQQIKDLSMVVRWAKNELMVVRPGCTLTDAWIWSERIRRLVEQSAINGDDPTIGATVSIGIADAPTRNMDSSMIDQTQAALRLAQRQGHNRIGTWDMVLIERILGNPAITKATNLSQRRDAFLKLCRPNLGPTQFEHLTSHSLRVAQMAVRIGQSMSLPIKEIYRIRMAALLHDIGKCLIPEQILAKPAALSFEEFQLMRLHVPLGARLASRLGVNEFITAMIYHHHTRYDCLRATNSLRPQAPLGARVLCGADAFVTMTSNRAYRPASEIDEAIQELRRQRGGQFDPDVVDAIEQTALPHLKKAA